MISKSKVVQLTEDFINESEFIVDITVSSSNKILIFIDSEQGVAIDRCIGLSKFIEEQLDRDEDDYELQVSSAGIGQAFKVYRQYVKNIDKEVEVLKESGEKLEGILKAVKEDGFDLECSKKVKLEGKKKKEIVTEVFFITFEEAKSVKNIIKF